MEDLIMPTELKDYIKGFFVKVLENLSSVKVWFFILPFIVSTAILSVLVGAHIGLVKTSLTAIVAGSDLESFKCFKTRDFVYSGTVGEIKFNGDASL